ncbi:MAG: NAD(P)-dependent alcohol dehydrogenase [Micromonosporaceae bacterium]|nr:NAD(P)-dependent alcohol dehydrogenase [Micromonosporaceae bacterium]
MKAIRYRRYGPPGVLELADVARPVAGADDLLVRVRAASVNPRDYHFMRGTPYLVRLASGLSRPRQTGFGVDMAGEVEAVGGNVTAFRLGDEVFGYRDGALAEYVTVGQDAVVLAKPARLSFEQAAAVPVAGFTALQALRDKARVRPGHKVLVNAAAGGVGTFAVQIAKALGAEVTGVCSTRNVDLVASIGADHVIDYTDQDFTSAGTRYDAIIDMFGTRTLRQIRRALAPRGVLVAVGGPDRGNWIGPLAGLAKSAAASPFVSQRLTSMLARPLRADLAALGEMLETGQIAPVIDRTYALTEVPEAIRYLETGHARGKVVITGI